MFIRPDAIKFTNISEASDAAGYVKPAGILI